MFSWPHVVWSLWTPVGAPSSAAVGGAADGFRAPGARGAFHTHAVFLRRAHWRRWCGVEGGAGGTSLVAGLSMMVCHVSLSVTAAAAGGAGGGS